MTENPYAAPQSDVNVDDGKRGRPILVWLIFIFACLGLFGILGHFAMVTGFMPLPDGIAEYYASLGILDHILIVFGTLFGFWAALTLFRLKKSALWWYLAAIPASLLNTLYTYNKESWQALMQATGRDALSSLAPGYIYLLLCVGYTYYLYKKGRLK
ncbi:MAG: hypothetical protein KZQ58_10440 [gamma proteobacterium symbiont of Bathyaustriella thionipta]|nr:hypothetical protein [gamma proteobacterium symbiont of Bathyaustriella thionipta]